MGVAGKQCYVVRMSMSANSVSGSTVSTNQGTVTTKSGIPLAFAQAFHAQLTWCQLKVRARTAILDRLRELLVEHRHELAAAVESKARQDYRETVTSELMPLADATRWLHRKAKRILAPRYIDGGATPFWLGRLRSTVHRVPVGLVMVIGTWNYPLFLPGVQILHALAAGNAVAFKPAPGCEKLSRLFVDLLIRAGVPADLIVLLDSDVDTAKTAIQAGVNKLVMTGSSRSGRAVLHQLADTLTPAVMELSGCDAIYVLPGADLHRVCDLVLFGLRLNGGATCMAPRRIFLPKKSSEVFHRLLSQRLEAEQQQKWSTQIALDTYNQLWDGVEDAIHKGAKIFSGPLHRKAVMKDTSSDDGSKQNASLGDKSFVECGHLVLTDMDTQMQLCSADIFAPLAMIIPVDDWSDALRADSRCPYALTASVFGPTEDALRIVKFISAGVITINDLIVPTADPQLPFGGRGESGFGVTRGSEGLLEMTCPKVVSVRLGSWLPHTKLPEPSDEALLDGLLQFNHANGWMKKWKGLLQTIKAAMSQQKGKRSDET
jgi:aldehyde dehydrogenase (NAD+)